MINTCFLYQLIGKLLLGFLELFRKTIFISATLCDFNKEIAVENY